MCWPPSVVCKGPPEPGVQDLALSCIVYAVKSLCWIIAVVESLHPLGSCRELADRELKGVGDIAWGGGGRANQEHFYGVYAASQALGSWNLQTWEFVPQACLTPFRDKGGEGGVCIGASIGEYCRSMLTGAAALQQLQNCTCSLHDVKLVGSAEHGGLCCTPSPFFLLALLHSLLKEKCCCWFF